VVATDGTNGTTSVDGPGNVTYTHDGSPTTSDTFTYTVLDDQGAISNSATVTITVGACSSGRSITGGQWSMISLDCAPDPLFNKVVDVFGDDISGTYNDGGGGTWLMYRFDPLANQYVALSSTDSLQQGFAYWILVDTGATLTVDGTSTPLVVSPECPSVDGCFEIALTPPPDAGTAKRWNMVGPPYPYCVDYANALIVVTSGPNAGTYSPRDAEQVANAGFEVIQVWNGGAYEPKDQDTFGMEGVLNPLVGFWYAVDDHTLNPGDIKMLLPPVPCTAQQAFNTLGTPKTTRYAGLWKVFERLAVLFVAPARAANGGDKGQGRKVGLMAKEWAVRLTAEWPDGNLKDPGNILGELIDSESGYDSHDLEELSPFSSPYLTIVFPHADWGERAGSYASDYRGLKQNKHEGDTWQFEVRTDQPGREVTLTWGMHGDYPEMLTLIDLESGEIVDIDPSVPGSYTFVMDATVHRFEWSY
jgi:hypothetical protein